MSYYIHVSTKAERNLAKIQKRDAKKIADEIEKLADDPRPRWTKKLHGLPGLRIDIGDFRIIYTIDDANKKIFIIDVGDRKDIYR